ncbi:alpha/beta hydrolase family protein [Actinophytocola gossypii]|uniref:alpha/beta hydrolase family protein n=1 Tax=Actinophytocola gossypii TaxID=2812003 RepID=UPI0021A8B51D|nr:alpha/beta fold hydrolase [Actinophytocola gossypii]
MVVGHGFTNHVRKPFVTRLLHRLAREHTVIALDFRGHGRSGGRSTAGPLEVHDLDAGVRLAREYGHERVATLGFSMGGTVALLHAATGTHRPDAVVAVSAACRWWVRDTDAMRRLFWLAELPHGRLALRTLGVRLARPVAGIPTSPIEVAHRIPPTPLLLVHGTEDHYVGVDHPLAVHRATEGRAELWLERGVRHAETAMTPELVDRMTAWLGAATHEQRSERTAA